MVVYERDYLSMCPTPPAPVRSYKIKLHPPGHLQHPSPYKRPAPPEEGEKFTLSAMHAKSMEEAANNPSPRPSVFAFASQPQIVSVLAESRLPVVGSRAESRPKTRTTGTSSSQSALQRRPTSNPYCELPSADDAAMEHAWSPHRKVKPSTLEEGDEASARVKKMVMCMPSNDVLATTLQKSMSFKPSAKTTEQKVQLMSKSYRKEEGPRPSPQRPHFALCFGRMKDGFKTQDGPQHERLLRDIETDDLLVKLRHHKRQDLITKAQGQVVRDELRGKMTAMRSQRMHDSLIRKEPYMMWKLEKTMKEHGEARRREVELCGVHEMDLLASPRELSRQIVESLRQNDVSTSKLKTGSYVRPLTARIIRDLKSKIVEQSDPFFIAAHPTSARLVSAKSRILVESRKRCGTAKTVKLASPWSLTAGETIHELDEVFRKTGAIEEFEADD